MRAGRTLFRSVSVLPAGVLLAAGYASAATAPPEVRDIDARCTAAAKLDDAHKTRLRILADVSEAVRPKANDGRGKWVPFHSADELASYAQKNGAPNTQAQTWSAPDGTFIASMFFQSDSGDWSHDVDYCFRADGTLARSKAVLVNHAADTSGSRTVYYAADGRVLLSKARSSNAAGKPRAGSDGLDTPPVYPTVKSLPFNAGAGGDVPAGEPSVDGSAGQAPPPRTDGGLDPNEVANHVKSQIPAVRGCYERELAKNRDLAGRVVVHWTIDVPGTTSDVTIESADPRLADVAACIVELIKKWRFSGLKGGAVEVRFPFVFQSTDARPAQALPSKTPAPPVRSTP